MFHSPFCTQTDLGTPKRGHPATPSQRPGLPDGASEPERPSLKKDATNLVRLRVTAYLAGLTAEKISAAVLPLIHNSEEKLIAYTAAMLKTDERKRKEALSALVVEWKLPGFPPDAAPVLTTSVCSTLPALPNANHDICKKIGGRRKCDYHKRLEGQREAEKLPNGGAGSPDGHSQTELPTAGNAKDARCSVSMSAYQNVQKEPCAVRDSNPHR